MNRGGLGGGSGGHPRGSYGGSGGGFSGVGGGVLLLVLLCGGDVERAEGKLRHGGRRHGRGGGGRLLELLKVLTEHPLLVLRVDDGAEERACSRSGSGVELGGDHPPPSPQVDMRAGDVQGGYGAGSGCRRGVVFLGYLTVQLLAPLPGLHDEALLLLAEMCVGRLLLCVGSGFRFSFRGQRPGHVRGTLAGRLFFLPLDPLVGESRARIAHHLAVFVLVDVLDLVLAQAPVALHEGGGAGHRDSLVGRVGDAALRGVHESGGALLVDQDAVSLGRRGVFHHFLGQAVLIGQIVLLRLYPPYLSHQLVGVGVYDVLCRGAQGDVLGEFGGPQTFVGGQLRGADEGGGEGGAGGGRGELGDGGARDRGADGADHGDGRRRVHGGEGEETRGGCMCVCVGGACVCVGMCECVCVWGGE